MTDKTLDRGHDRVLQQVQEAIEAHQLIVPGTNVVVGLSGGPDSLCLLHVLKRLRERYNFKLHVAHLNHGTRGTASDADAEFVREVATQWNLPITTEKRDVPKLADEQGLAFEEAARRMRYAFLAHIAAEIGATTIAVGHQADDQAETVLMHIIRGAGLAGLRGMLPRTPLTDYRLLGAFTPDAEIAEGRAEGTPRERTPPDQMYVIRPLLGVPRGEVERYCAEYGLSPRFDRSNLDTTYFRNRLRHELLPQLETYNPRIRERLCHMAAVAAADYELLVEVRQQAWDRIVRDEGVDGIIFDQEAWHALPVSLQRGTLRRATRKLRRTLRDVAFVHVENAREVALEGETGKEATLPMGLALTVGYDTLRIGPADTPGPPPNEPLLWTKTPLPISVAGTAPLPNSEWVLNGECLDQWAMTEIEAPDHPWTGYFDAEALEEPVVLRPRRPGDRFRPLGMGGHQLKISDLMINLKIPEPWRDHVPLLVAGGEVLWVCGHRVAETGKVRPTTSNVVRFRFERAGRPYGSDETESVD